MTRDKRAFEIISRIISSIFERIQVNNRTAQTHERAYNILKTCKSKVIAIPNRVCYEYSQRIHGKEAARDPLPEL